MAKKFWSFRNVVETNGKELVIEGPISEESWWGDEATPSQLRQELAEFDGEKLTVSLNSGGGDVFAGLAMYNALRELNAEVTIRVDGLAASIASIIAMAGDKIIMSPGTQMMIHRPSVLAAGNVDDLDKAKEVLLKIEESIIPIYSERTGLSKEKIAEMLEEETWMTADEAVELGFADEAIHLMKEAPEAKKSLDLKLAFSMSATEQSVKDLNDKVKLSEQKEVEDVAKPVEAEAPADTASAVEPDAEAQKEAIGDETKTAEVVEPVVEVTNKSTDKETKMDNKEIAKAQVLEPEAQAPVEPKAEKSNYLNSMKSVVDFGETLYANMGKEVKDVKAAWKKSLIKNGITNPDSLDLPAPLVGEIKDAVEASQIYNKLNNTGLDSLKVLWDDTDKNADASRAGQHNPDYMVSSEVYDKTKEQQVLTFDDRELEADYIYKYLVLDKKTVRKNRSSGALIRFVLRELPQRIIREMERAAIIGDGRADGDKRKVTSFISVKSDVVANNTFGTTYVPVAGESRYESVARAKDLILAQGAVYLIAKKGFATAARFEKNNDGDLLFPVGTRAQDIFEVEGIIEPDWFTDTTDPDYDAYLVVLSAYDTVGDDSIEAFTNFRLETNENEYLQEIFKGGGLTGLKAAVGIPVATS